MGRRDSLGVDRDDDALAAELLRRFAHEIGARHRGGVDRHLVGAGEQQAADILDRAHPAADGQRHKAFLGGAANDVVERIAVLGAGGDVKKAQLVGALTIVKTGLRHRIAGIDQIDKIDALDDPPVLDVEARDHPHLQHAGNPATSFKAARGSMRPS